MRLSSKVPLQADLSSNLVERLLVCETSDVTGEDGDPLLVCVMTDSILVSFPTKASWDRDRLLVEFRELLADESWDDVSEEIDNLARSVHSAPIIERNREGVRLRCSDFESLWRCRGDIYPHLLFGPDVPDHFSRLNTRWLRTLQNRLTELDKTVRDWRVGRHLVPRWRCKVTPESQSVMKHPRLSKMRRFRSVVGQTRQFAWHARFGALGRIHFRLDADVREIEIGYIGKHLPTARFR